MKKFKSLITLFLSVFTLICIPTSVAAINTTTTTKAKTIEGYICSSSIYESFILPRHIYFLKDYTSFPYIYFKNALLSKENPSIYSKAPYGTNSQTYWTFNTFNNTFPHNNFRLRLITEGTSESHFKKTTVHFVDTTKKTPIRLLAIGDSLTRAGTYLSEVDSKLPNISFLGTRSYPSDDIPNREGRGGWTLEKYFKCIGTKELDSPFIFPTDVDGKHYKGNTYEWKNICYEKPNDYLYDGFQKLARGWKEQGPFLYDSEGYLKHPSIGDVMVNPTLPTGKQWIEWNGDKWVTQEIQNKKFEFNFAKYIERNQTAFNYQKPTHVSILLGANEFGYKCQTENTGVFIQRLKDMIGSIHRYDPTIKIIICTPTLGPNPDKITSPAKNFYAEYNLRMKYAAACILEVFDTKEAQDNLIYIAPLHLTLDSDLGFDYIQKFKTINRTSQYITEVKNSIHPSNTYGQPQMGRTLAAVLQNFR